MVQSLYRVAPNGLTTQPHTVEAVGMEQKFTDQDEREVPRRRHGGSVAATPLPRASPSPPPLTYVRLGERPLRRFPQLFAGLALYGFGLSVMVRSSLGLSPWSVLNEGLEPPTRARSAAVPGSP